jgi:hypothetical protein
VLVAVVKKRLSISADLYNFAGFESYLVRENVYFQAVF